jgi:hypothetical protein
MSKYHNQIVRNAHGTFASKAEARYHDGLLLRERAGEVADIRRQVRYPLVVNGILICTYVADYVYREVATNRELIIDVKGVETVLFRQKRKLLRALYGLEITIVPARET